MNSITGTRKGFVDLTSFIHDYADKGFTIYPTVASLAAGRDCVFECGIAEVEVKVVHLVKEPKI